MSSNQKPIIIGLAVVIILLAAIVGFLIIQNGSSNNTNTATQDPNSVASSSTQMQEAVSKAAPFDEKTATKLKKGVTPETWVKEYYKAANKQDWETAWNHLPAAKRDVTTPEQLGQHLSGITGYKIDSSKKNSDGDLEISVVQGTSAGDFTIIWTFMPKGDTYLLKDRVVAGMGN